MNENELAKEQFQKMVEEYSPNSHLVRDCIRAFFVGGAICTFGQWIYNLSAYFGAEKEHSQMITTMTLIVIASILTGLGLYEKIGKFAGAGSVVPITGFANSIVATAIEFKKEGLIFGLGAKMFTLAGPVLVYGISTSIIVGIVYFFMK